MISSQDHKCAYDGNKGPNTGGMGTFSPSPIYTKELAEECCNKIFIPTMNAMNSEGRKFKGVLYFGLMLTKKGIMVIEYNSRFGDPETQVVLPLLESDLFDIFEAVADERLSEADIRWSDKAAVCVIMASEGYPKSYKTGFEIKGLDRVSSTVYHAGTKKEDNKILTSGGRVLGVTAVGNNLTEARDNAYKDVVKISFQGAFYRKDIGIDINIK
jgi:phosphoribosylamine--glycine ligase